jgi:hypothetical protein
MIDKVLFFKFFISKLFISIGLSSCFLNINKSNIKAIKDAANVGRNITLKYSKKPISNAVAIYILVWLPIIKNILQVFAQTNSITKKGIGFILVAFEK